MADAVRARDGSFVGADDVRIAWRAWEPVRPTAALIVVHGLGDHAGRYTEFGERMGAAGIATYALDLRGHGRSTGRRGDLPSFDDVLRDIDTFRSDIARRNDAATPVFLLGQSLGGLIALRCMQEHGDRYRGAVICSPWLATAMPVPRWKLALAPLLARLLPTLQIPHGLVPAELSRDRAVVHAYRDDALVQPYITPRTYARITDAIARVGRHDTRFAAPLLFMMGGADRVVDTDVTLAFARAVPAPDVTIRVLPDHLHELLLEVDRAAIHDEIAGWVTTMAARASP
jgi:acylglycerol lipase